MVTEPPRRTSFSGPALVRLLSRLAQVEVTESGQTPARRLSEWLGWTESIVLSTVLGATAPAAPVRTADDDDVIDAVELANAEYAQVLGALQQAIAAALTPPAPTSEQRRRQMRGAPKALMDVDFPSYRRRYSLLQQKMESSIAALRGRLRALLAARSPEMARLAAVDAAMEKALVEHELRLLDGIPNLLERRFLSLAQTGRAEKSAQEAGSQPSSQLKAELEPGPWLDAFRDDMRSVLLAELDLRLQPVEGLLSALRGQSA